MKGYDVLDGMRKDFLEETANQAGTGAHSIQAGRARRISTRAGRAVHIHTRTGGGVCRDSQQRGGSAGLLMRFIIIFIPSFVFSLLAECEVHNRTWNVGRYFRAKAV